MHNFNRTRTPSKDESIRNLVTIEEYIDSSYYSKWIPASEFITAALLGNYNAVSAAELPDALDTILYCTFKKPTKWQQGLVGINIHYTGTRGAGTYARVLYSLSPIESEEVIPAAPLDSIITIAPNSTGAYTIYKGMNVSISNLYEVTENDRSIAVAIKRTGGHADDTYANTFYLIGVEVVYKEYKNVAANKFDHNDQVK